MRATRILAVTLLAAARAACNDSDSEPTPPQTNAVAKLRVQHRRILDEMQRSI